MNPALHLITGILAIAMAIPALAQESIFELPPSKNFLVNYSIDLLQRNPESNSFEAFSRLLAQDIRNSSEKAKLFSSINEAFLQVSQETIVGEKIKLATGSYGEYVPSNEGSVTSRMGITIRDERLRNMAEPISSHAGVFGTTMTQIHSLSKTEFAIFADEFIEVLKSTQADLPEINRIKREYFTAFELDQARRVIGESAFNERLVEFTKVVKTSATERYAESLEINITPAAKLLTILFSKAIDIENTKGPQADTIIQRQRVRILELMAKALIETDVYTPRQKAEIARIAQAHSVQDGKGIADKKYRKAVLAAYTSKEVKALTAKVRDLSEGKILSCRKTLRP